MFELQLLQLLAEGLQQRLVLLVQLRLVLLNLRPAAHLQLDDRLLVLPAHPLVAGHLLVQLILPGVLLQLARHNRRGAQRRKVVVVVVGAAAQAHAVKTACVVTAAAATTTTTGGSTAHTDLGAVDAGGGVLETKRRGKEKISSQKHNKNDRSHRRTNPTRLAAGAKGTGRLSSQRKRISIRTIP